MGLVHWLEAAEAGAALDALVADPIDERDLPRRITALRERFTADQAGALVDQHLLRRRAVEKFGSLAARMLFDEQALEQASGLVVARHRAARYAGRKQVADLGCGIGGDAIALVARVGSLVGVERDPVRTRLARHNLRVAGAGDRAEVVEGDLSRLPLPTGLDAVFADPGRRAGGRRRFRVEELEPPLETLLALRDRARGVAIKLMPGIADDAIPPESEIEFVSHDGAMKEAVLWLGDFLGPVRRRATLLRGAVDGTVERHEMVATGDDGDDPPVGTPLRFLYEPDPAIIRATLVGPLAASIGARLIDPRIAYMTSDTGTATPFARRWPVIEHAPFGLKPLNRRLRALDAEVVTVKKRGAPIEPERFRRRLASRRGGRPVTVFITRHQEQPWMLICGDEVRGDDHE